jgi:hypothetical protein
MWSGAAAFIFKALRVVNFVSNRLHHYYIGHRVKTTTYRFSHEHNPALAGGPKPQRLLFASHDGVSSAQHIYEPRTPSTNHH